MSQKVIKKKEYIEEISEKYLKKDYFTFKQIGKYNTKLIPKIASSKKRFYYEPKNNIGVLWDELECFLLDDEHFIIEKIIDDTIVIKVLRKEAFHLVFIMSKILGRIMPFNANLKMDLENYRGENYKEDMFILDFTIKTSKDFYKGTIYVKF